MTLPSSAGMDLCATCKDYDKCGENARPCESQKEFTLKHTIHVPEGPLRDKLLASGLFTEEA